jgi:cytochrome c-type biogenesis protein CcmH
MGRARSALRSPADALLVAATVVIVVASLLAVLGLRPATLEERARRLESELRCPVCQGLSIADSPAELASEMRALVTDQLDAGASDADVRAYFVERYGRWILLAPDASGPNLLLWAVPGVLLIGGAGAVVARARRRDRRTSTESARRVILPKPHPLAKLVAIGVVIAAIGIPLAVATGPRSPGQEISGGQQVAQQAPSLEELQARASADPTDVVTLVALGDALTMASRSAEAAAAYGSALKSQPDDVGALIGLASLLLGAGRPDGALPLVDRAVTVAPGLPDGYLYRAIARYQLAGFLTAEARLDVLRFLDLAPSDPRRTLAQQLLAKPGSSGTP